MVSVVIRPAPSARRCRQSPSAVRSCESSCGRQPSSDAAFLLPAMRGLSTSKCRPGIRRLRLTEYSLSGALLLTFPPHGNPCAQTHTRDTIRVVRHAQGTLYVTQDSIVPDERWRLLAPGSAQPSQPASKRDFAKDPASPTLRYRFVELEDACEAVDPWQLRHDFLGWKLENWQAFFYRAGRWGVETTFYSDRFL